MRELTKDITLDDGSRYQLRKLPALHSARIFNLLLAVVTRARKQDDAPEAPTDSREPTDVEVKEQAARQVGFMWMLAATELDEHVYAKIQGQALNAVCLLQETGPVPVRMADGRWAMKDLENDEVVIDRLISETLKFNLAGFFIAGLSKPAATAGPV